jgi:hypothetical protein
MDDYPQMSAKADQVRSIAFVQVLEQQRNKAPRRSGADGRRYDRSATH